MKSFALTAVAAVGVVASLAAQSTGDRAVDSALTILARDNEWTLTQQIALCEIPAPPFKEGARAADFAARIRALGYQPSIDAVGNVVTIRRGTGGGKRLMLAGHLDTVFPEGTPVTVRRTGSRLASPGIGDDCRGLAVVLAVARALELAHVTTKGDLVLVANVGEEGPGNLRGARHLFETRPGGPIDAFVSVDGIGFGLVSRAVGSNRYRVVFKGPGGHSYGAFGMPNPIHAMGRAIAAIADLAVPTNPRTIFNVGVVEGGTSVNSIAGTATMQVDLRSESAEALEQVDRAFQRAVAEAVTKEKARWSHSTVPLSAEVEVIGKRPAGSQPDSSWIVRLAQTTAQALGVTPPPPETGSTDANVPIGLGIPGIAISGGGEGDGAHSLGEWYDDGKRGYLGPQWALLLAIRVTQQ